MTWHEAFMMIPINIDQFQIKYRSVAVELSVINLPSLVKFVFGWSVGYLLVGWSLRGRMSHLSPPYYSSTQLQLSSTPNQLPELHSIKEITVVCFGVTLSLDLGFWALSFFSFCINRGAFLSLIDGEFVQVHSGEICNIFCIWIKQEDFGG